MVDASSDVPPAVQRRRDLSAVTEAIDRTEGHWRMGRAGFGGAGLLVAATALYLFGVDPDRAPVLLLLAGVLALVSVLGHYAGVRFERFRERILARPDEIRRVHLHIAQSSSGGFAHAFLVLTFDDGTIGLRVAEGDAPALARTVARLAPKAVIHVPGA